MYQTEGRLRRGELEFSSYQTISSIISVLVVVLLSLLVFYINYQTEGRLRRGELGAQLLHRRLADSYYHYRYL